MGRVNKKTVILYPYVYEERDAVSAMVRELAAMLAEDKNVVVIAADSDRPIGSKSRTLWEFRYLAKALRYAIAHHRNIAAIISIDAPTGVRLVGILPRLISANRIITVSWVLDMYSAQVARLQQGFLPRNRVREFLDNLGLRASSRVVVLGKCMANNVKSLSAKEAVVIPIWKSPTVQTRNLRRRLGLMDGQFVVLYAGTAGSNHPMSGLIGAVASLADTNLVLLIAGRGSEVQQARERVMLEGLTNVVFVDPVDDQDVPALYASANLHVAILDERVTGTCVPSKVYSAMAAGRPCLFLGSSQSQASLDITAAGAGSTVEPRDVDGIARELQKYIEASGLAISQGNSGLFFMAEQRSPAEAAKRWKEVLS